MKREFNSFQTEINNFLKSIKMSKDEFVNQFFRDLLGLDPPLYGEDENMQAARSYVWEAYGPTVINETPTFDCPDCNRPLPFDMARIGAYKVPCGCKSILEVTNPPNSEVREIGEWFEEGGVHYFEDDDDD